MVKCKWKKCFLMYLVSCFTRKKFINFNKFMVKCKWKKCFLTFYLLSCFTRKKFINFNKFMVKWGESRTANSDRGLLLGVGGSRKTKSGRGRGETFFPDSGSDRDSDETFQISRNLGLEHVEFVCLLDSQLWQVYCKCKKCIWSAHNQAKTTTEGSTSLPWRVYCKTFPGFSIQNTHRLMHGYKTRHQCYYK